MSKSLHQENHEITAATFPALRSFLRGYFHEDMADEYGTLEEAASQFYEDADPDERKSVAGEWVRFLAQTKGHSLPSINKLLEKLGSACRLKPDDIEKISRAFQGLPPKQEESADEDEEW
jgi:CdiI immunity protein